ncbi:NYN domain-containing protein [Singulisphaera sp. PoT]|uniref:NYN domain-containing protein n=1 Tax=Singulisphaera sp. PoT TaxID=3411797 RepID=UPI003BF4E7EB
MSLNASNLGRGKSPETPPQERVIAYVDGFNLYFGMKSKGWRRYYWLDIKKFTESYTLPHQQLISVKYFTSRIRAPEDKRKRQATFLEALETLDGLTIHYGQFYDQPFKCPACKTTELVPAEKMTDVNIATRMLVDAFADRFDTALLVSADSDLAAPVKAIREVFPQKRVVIAFPPDRVSNELKSLANAHIFINKIKLSENQLPDTVVKPDGFELQKPQKWG